MQPFYWEVLPRHTPRTVKPKRVDFDLIAPKLRDVVDNNYILGSEHKSDRVRSYTGWYKVI